MILRFLPTREVSDVKPAKAAVPLEPAAEVPKSLPAPETKTRAIPASLRHQIWKRDQGRCAQCKGQNALQIDHIQPYSLSGPSTLENLQLVCRSCNQRRAILKLGEQTMGRYLRS